MTKTPLLLLPPGAWDTHHHIFSPSTHPYSPTRHLTPPPASISQYQAFQSRLGISHSVLVHGLCYGHDTTSLTSFRNSLGQKTTGVAVISRSTKENELRDLHDAGVRGIRLDFYSENAMEDLEKQKSMLRYYADKIAPLNWSLGFLQLKAENWEGLAEIIPDLAVNVVVDHFGLLKGTSLLDPGTEISSQPGLHAITRLLTNPRQNFWIKLSAPYRCSSQGPHHADLKELVQLLVSTNPRRVVWGSDWPHTPRMKIRTKEEALKETPFLEIDDETWLRTLREWMSEEEWNLVMVENPRVLFGQ